MNCTVCGAGPARPKVRLAGVEVVECPSCGLAWWTPSADFEPESVYDDHYFSDTATAHGYDDYGALEGALRATFARRIAGLADPEGAVREGAASKGSAAEGTRAVRASRLLDIGAAYGFAVSEARRLGWRAQGIEVSTHAARAAARVAPGCVTVGSALEVPFADGSFDAVTLWDVIEHLPDPHAAVREVARLLRPGGSLALTTGDVGSLVARLSGSRWHLYTLPEHLFFYTRRSLRELMEAHGLVVDSMRAAASYYTVGYLVERLRKTLLRSGASRARAWPGAGRVLPFNLFDIVWLRCTRA